MTTNQLKKDSIVPFIKLLETNGELYGDKFIGLGVRDGKLFLVKMHARPERVSVMGGEFAFLNKKGDGPAFNIENGQNREQALAAYQFYGDDKTHFEEVMAIPESEMQRVLMGSALKQLLDQHNAGGELNVEQLFTHMFEDLSQVPNAVDLIMQEDPSISQAEATLAVELSQKLHTGELNADEFLAQAGVPQEVLERAEALVTAEAVEPPVEAVTKPHVEVTEVAPQSHAERLFSRFGWNTKVLLQLQ